MCFLASEGTNSTGQPKRLYLVHIRGTPENSRLTLFHIQSTLKEPIFGGDIGVMPDSTRLPSLLVWKGSFSNPLSRKIEATKCSAGVPEMLSGSALGAKRETLVFLLGFL